MRKFNLLAAAGIAFLLAGCTKTAADADREPPKGIDVAAAVRWANGETEDAVHMFGTAFRMPIEVRLLSLLIEGAYEYHESDVPAWERLMHDKKAHVFARLCAARFLAHSNDDARDFLAEHAVAHDLRVRYAAAKAIEMYVERDPRKTWGVNVLIQLIDSGALDGTDDRSCDAYDYPIGYADSDGPLTMVEGINSVFGAAPLCLEALREGNAFTPLDDICWDLGFMK
jgi:hypothetical protein